MEGLGHLAMVGLYEHVGSEEDEEMNYDGGDERSRSSFTP